MSTHEAGKGSVFPNDRESSNRAAGEPSVGGDARLGARIARARHNAGLTQRALADLVGVRLWVVDQWESGARAVPLDQLDVVAKATNRTLHWLETGVGERASEQIAPESADADVRFEEPRRELDERLAEVARREAEVRQKEHELQQALAEADEQRAVPESGRGGLAEIEAARREVDERLAEIAEREAALAVREQELQTALSAQADEQGQYHQGLVDVQQEDAVQQALAQADELRGELERERAKLAESKEARRRVESSRAEVAARERVVAEREARLEARALGLGGEGSDLKALAQWLTDSVKAAAKREAETVLKAAREQARQIIANANAEREPPVEATQQDEPVQKPEAPSAL